MNQTQFIIKLHDGLGNQMFQYALGRALSLRFGCALKADTSAFAAQRNAEHPRPYLLPLFPLTLPEATQQELLPFQEKLYQKIWRKLVGRRIYAKNYIREPHYSYWDGIRSINAPAMLDGYWQSERYFLDCAEQIKKDFTFPPLPDASLFMAEKIINSPQAVAVHVRRGDYLFQDNHALHGTCNRQFYKTSLQYIQKQISLPLEIFLFSDDIAWCKNNFDPCGLTIIFVDLHSESQGYYAMHLMSLCKHYIIANSSFSWWGAWLGEQKESVICAPAVWFSGEPEKGNPSPERWMRMQG